MRLLLVRVRPDRVVRAVGPRRVLRSRIYALSLASVSVPAELVMYIRRAGAADGVP